MEGKQHAAGAKRRRLSDQVRAAIRQRHYSYRTEQAYWHWIRRYILFHNRRHPLEMGKPEIAEFLTHLAVDRKVSASTQNQALNAVLFLYRHVLERDVGLIEGVTRAKPSAHLPVVMSREEVEAVLARLHGREWLAGSLMYGAGLRVMECVRLRVKDIDFGFRQVIVRDGKGRKDRITPLPDRLVVPLEEQLREVKRVHEADLADGFGSVSLPYALARKYPSAPRQLGWQYLFPASKRARDPRSGEWKRHHIDVSVIQRAVRAAVRAAGLSKPVTCHTFRHSFATHLIAAGHDIRTVQELLGHRDVRTTMIYTHVLGKGAQGVLSPFDTLGMAAARKQ